MSMFIRQLTSDWISLLSEVNNVSLKNSNEFRAIGNELYKNLNQNGTKCVNYYTRAIFTAPTDSQELGMAYANRAAALISLGYYQKAHSDCKLARLENYPKSKLIKVLWRQASCAIQLEDLDLFVSDLMEMNELLDELKIRHQHTDMSRYTNYIKNINGHRIKRNSIFNYSKKNVCWTQKIKRKGLVNRHHWNLCFHWRENIDWVSYYFLLISPHFLKATVVFVCNYRKQTLQKGRFVVASEQILTDELIVKEKAFAFIPVAQKFDQNPIDLHCQNCAATNIIPSPCGKCKRASYCGLSCLNQHQAIHQFECNGYKKHLWYEIGIAHLALRTMLCGINDLMKRINHSHDMTPLAAWNELLLSVEEPNFTYGSVLQLVTNFEKSNTDDFLGYVLVRCQ